MSDDLWAGCWLCGMQFETGDIKLHTFGTQYGKFLLCSKCFQKFKELVRA